MKLLSALVAAMMAASVIGDGCRNSRYADYILNKYDHASEDYYIEEDYDDTTTVAGTSQTFTTEFDFDIFSCKTKDFKVYDNGQILPLGCTATDPIAVNVAIDPIGTTNKPAIDIYAIDPDDPTFDYFMTVRHLKLSNMMTDGLRTGHSRCQLDRIESMINSCDAGNSEYTTINGHVTVDEALVVTWRITLHLTTTEAGQFQTILATGLDESNVRETFVIFISKGTFNAGLKADMRYSHFVNGEFATIGDIEYAAPCVPSDQDLIKDYTNCRCEDWLKGHYILATRDNDPNNNLDTYKSNTCVDSHNDWTTMCGAPTEHDDRKTYQMNCKPYRTPQDTCTADLYCQDIGNTVNNNWKYTFLVRDPAEWTNFVYVDVDTAAEIADDNTCRKTLTMNNAQGFGFFTGEVDKTDPGCGIEINGVEMEIWIRLYHQSWEDYVDFNRGRLLKFTCRPGELPDMIEAMIDSEGIFEITQNPLDNWEIKAFFAKEKDWDENTVIADNQYDDGDTVLFDSWLFPAISLDYGSNPPSDGAEAYAIQVVDCWVSNNAAFDHSGDDRTIKFLNDGCSTRTSDQSFYIDEQFLGQYLWQNGEDAPTSSYEFVTIAGGMHAAIIRPGNKLWFGCEIKYCRYRGFYDDSACKESCANFDKQDYTGTRKKKSVSDDETIFISTSIKVGIPTADPEAQKECVSSTVAITTLVALLVMLIMAVLVTVMLFVKLQRRNRKQ